MAIKEDKILNNSWITGVSQWNEMSQTTFQPVDSFKQKSTEEQLEDSELESESWEWLKTEYSKFIDTETKPTALEINEIWSNATRRWGKDKWIRLWSLLTDYLSVKPEWFYDVLTNNFKTGLFEELRKSGSLRGLPGNKPLF